MPLTSGSNPSSAITSLGEHEQPCAGRCGDAGGLGRGEVAVGGSEVLVGGRERRLADEHVCGAFTPPSGTGCRFLGRGPWRPTTLSTGAPSALPRSLLAAKNGRRQPRGPAPFVASYRSPRAGALTTPTSAPDFSAS